LTVEHVLIGEFPNPFYGLSGKATEIVTDIVFSAKRYDAAGFFGFGIEFDDGPIVSSRVMYFKSGCAGLRWIVHL
jgi:hypothetical protein